MRRARPSLLSRWGTIDIFFDDSDHSYDHQLWTYRTAWPFVREGGPVTYDDVDWTTGFSELPKRSDALRSTGRPRDRPAGGFESKDRERVPSPKKSIGCWKGPSHAQDTVLSSGGDLKGPFRGWLQYEPSRVGYFKRERGERGTPRRAGVSPAN